MSLPARAVCALLLGAIALCACTPALIMADAPKKVVGHLLPPYELHEECVELKPGDRLEYTFESTEPVDFNIHYHDGNAVVMPVVREKSRADAGVYAPPVAHHYCLMWEAGAAGAAIDYQVRLRPGA
jgi:hypothetical protein